MSTASGGTETRDRFLRFGSSLKVAKGGELMKMHCWKTPGQLQNRLETLHARALEAIRALPASLRDDLESRVWKS